MGQTHSKPTLLYMNDKKNINIKIDLTQIDEKSMKI